MIYFFVWVVLGCNVKLCVSVLRSVEHVFSSFGFLKSFQTLKCSCSEPRKCLKGFLNCFPKFPWCTLSACGSWPCLSLMVIKPGDKTVCVCVCVCVCVWRHGLLFSCHSIYNLPASGLHGYLFPHDPHSFIQTQTRTQTHTVCPDWGSWRPEVSHWSHKLDKNIFTALSLWAHKHRSVLNIILVPHMSAATCTHDERAEAAGSARSVYMYTYDDTLLKAEPPQWFLSLSGLLCVSKILGMRQWSDLASFIH